MSLGQVLIVAGIIIVVLLVVPILGGLLYYGICSWVKFFQRRREKQEEVQDHAMEGGKLTSALTPNSGAGSGLSAATLTGDGDGDHWIELQHQDP